MNDISKKLIMYLASKEKACDKILRDSYTIDKTAIKELEKTLNIIKRAKFLVNEYINDSNNLSDCLNLELLEKLTLICEDNINELLNCSSEIRKQNFSNISFWDHIPACINITADFKFMNECILKFSQELVDKHKSNKYIEKLKELEDILT